MLTNTLGNSLFQAKLSAASLSVTAGLAYAKPYLEYLFKKQAVRPILETTVRYGLQESTALSLRVTPMLRLLFGLNLAFLELMLVEIFPLPNRLQRYLDSCTFRNNRSNKAIESEEKEIETMQNAAKGTL